MSLRIKYDELDQKIKKLDERQNLISDEISKITEQQYTILQQIIQEEKLLQDTNWELKLNGDRVYLTCLDSRADESSSLHCLDTLLNNTYHYSFNLEEGSEIRFDDNQISIHFDENRLATPLIKKYGLKVSSGTVAGKLLALKRQMNQLEILAHQFNIKG
jgi:hypothetical protein